MSGHVQDRLRDEPWTFTFFQTVRLLQRWRADRKPVGYFARPEEEAVRFTVPPSVAFPASQVQEMQTGGSDAPTIGVNVFGLIGQQGVLPYWYSVVVQEAATTARPRNKAPLAFFDIFQHRMLSLFYRAWEKSRPEVAFERGGTDLLETGLRAAAGLATEGLRDRHELFDASLLFYSGLLGPTQRSALALEQLLTDYFDLPVSVEQFAGGWFTLDETALTRLGQDGASEELGLGTVLGDAIWNEQASVRIRIGPLTREAFESFLPGGAAMRELQALVRFYTGESVEVDAQLVLRQQDVRGVRLGDRSALPLGWGSWVATRPVTQDMDQVVLSL